MAQHTYPACMELAEQAMNSGKLTVAICECSGAINSSANNNEKAQAVQKLGIVQRLAHQLDRSERSLRLAMTLAGGDDQLTARIERDLAMTLLEQLTLGSRYRTGLTPELVRRIDFIKVVMMLYDVMKVLRDGDEYWITAGYVGRAYLMVGSRSRAREEFKRADEHLRNGDNRDYELNNLMWWLRTLPIWRRLSLLDRAEALIEETGQARRKPELAIVALGGNWLYRWLRRLTGK